MSWEKKTKTSKRPNCFPRKNKITTMQYIQVEMEPHCHLQQGQRQQRTSYHVWWQKTAPKPVADVRLELPHFFFPLRMIRLGAFRRLREILWRQTEAEQKNIPWQIVANSPNRVVYSVWFGGKFGKWNGSSPWIAKIMISLKIMSSFYFSSLLVWPYFSNGSQDITVRKQRVYAKITKKKKNFRVLPKDRG